MSFCEGNEASLEGSWGMRLTAFFAENEGVCVRFLG